MEEIELEVTTQNYEGVLVITPLTSRVHASQVGDLTERLNALVDQSGTQKVLVNFENVEFISSSVLGELLKLRKRLMTEDGALKLFGLQPRIMKIFKLTRLHRVFDIFNDFDKALDSFK